MLKRFLPPVILLILWEAVTWGQLSSPLLLPAPSRVFVTMLEMIENKQLLVDIGQSLLRVLTGFSLAVILGTPLGLWIALNRRAAFFFEPLIHFLRPIPPIAWVPLAILWFGIGNGSSYFLTLMAAIFPIVLNVHLGVKSISPQHFNVARCFEAPFSLVLRKIIWPATLPFAMSGYRIGLGVAWMTVVGAEMIAARSGLGYLIHSSQDLLRTDKVMVGMIAIGLIGLGIDVLLRRLERRLAPWRNSLL